MAFHDVRISDSIARNFQGGPSGSTTIVQLLSGREYRNKNWSALRRSYNAAYPFSRDDWRAIIEFFIAREAAAHSFRFKDWTDYALGDPDAVTYQTIGTGDGATTDFQLYKRYTSGGVNLDRDITKPVAGTVRVWVDGVEAVGGWTVDTLTGIVSFGVAPGGSPDPVISALCEFDVPVRFSGDSLVVNMTTTYVAEIPAIALIEVIGE